MVTCLRQTITKGIDLHRSISLRDSYALGWLLKRIFITIKIKGETIIFLWGVQFSQVDSSFINLHKKVNSRHE